MPPVITLTTDFGLGDSYVAAMKGVILSVNPAAQLVDLSHEIPPQDIRAGAFCLSQAFPYFPPGTIHVVVVDPGVGSQRRLLCVRMHGHFFLAPDNGVLSWSARGATQIERIELAEPQYWRAERSNTFHGRDILAPAAAHLSCGVAHQKLGRPVNDWIEIPWPAPTRQPRRLRGEVLLSDRFGNLITNIAQSDLPGSLSTRVHIAGVELSPVRTYSDGAVGEPLALVGSSRLVEIAVRNGSAARRLGAGPGSVVEISWNDS